MRSALLDRLASDDRDTLWPVMTAPGTGRERIERALSGLCEVAGRHLPLLLASETVFRQAGPPGVPCFHAIIQ